MDSIFIKTYGCTLNRADSDMIAGLLLERGHKLAGSEEEAGIIIVNTCGVKETTENKIMHYLKRLDDAGKYIIVAGCLPVMNLPGVRKAAPCAIGYLGPNSLDRIPALLGSKSKMTERIFLKDDFNSKFHLQKIPSFPVARIQTSSGCLSNCTFCATKIARGRFESKPARLILEEAKAAISNRAKEIQLASQDNGCYGFDLKTSLPSLLEQLNDLEGRFLIRVGMANPQYVLKNLDSWIEAFKLPKIYKFLHLPIQSGSNRILKLMQRGYAAEEAAEVAVAFRKAIPEITLETDVIVGFPSETAQEFNETLELCEKLSFDVVNVSKYSKRRGTTSAKMRQFHSSIIKDRSEILDRLVKGIALRQNRKFVGQSVGVLITEQARNGYLQGRSESYKAVLVPEKGRFIGEFVDSKIVSASVTSLISG